MSRKTKKPATFEERIYEAIRSNMSCDCDGRSGVLESIDDATYEVLEIVKKVFKGGSWTTVPPTEQGYYWLRNAWSKRLASAEPKIVWIDEYVMLNGYDHPVIGKLVSGEWYGPIQPPTE